MDDTISRQAAIEAVEKESQVDGAYGYMDTKSIVDLLNDLPSAQPEIIRCKDCTWFDSPRVCLRHGRFVENNNWFCADGERRRE